jgi:hypothetical protein
MKREQIDEIFSKALRLTLDKSGLSQTALAARDRKLTARGKGLCGIVRNSCANHVRLAVEILGSGPTVPLTPN